MKRLLIAALVLAFAIPAFAGQNPCVRMYVDFDPPNYVHSIDGSMVAATAYIMVDCLEGGVTNVNFRVIFEDDIWTILAPSFVNLMPGDLAIGNYRDGISISSTECLMGEQVQIGYVSLLLSGTPGCIEVGDHPQFARWVVDCATPEPTVDYYCVLANGSVNGGVCPAGDENCTCPCGSPVEDSSWSGIKALYR